jgi:hypothetical protein
VTEIGAGIIREFEVMATAVPELEESMKRPNARTAGRVTSEASAESRRYRLCLHGTDGRTPMKLVARENALRRQL